MKLLCQSTCHTSWLEVQGSTSVTGGWIGMTIGGKGGVRDGGATSLNSGYIRWLAPM
jgi:hypothetical protein